MTYLASKHSTFLASLDKPPVMPIQHGPSDLMALRMHYLETAHQFVEYVQSIAREASSLNVSINPEQVAGEIRDALDGCDLAQSIREEAERMTERVAEDA
jgi:hypothetical protein